MNILVTGAAGFIGSHLCDYLLKKNFNVTGVDNFSLGLKGNIEHLESNDNFTFFKMDLTDFDSSLQLYQNKDIDMTFHLAANSDIRKGIESTRTDLDCNLISTYNVLESMKQTGSTKILFSPLCKIVGSFVPTSSILRLTISIDCFKAELFIVNRPYFENKTFTLLFSKISKSNSNEL